MSRRDLNRWGPPRDYQLAMGLFHVPAHARMLWQLCVVEAYGWRRARPRFVLTGSRTIDAYLHTGRRRRYRAAADAIQPLLEAGILTQALEPDIGYRAAVHELRPWRSWAWPPGMLPQVDAFLSLYLQPEERTDGRYQSTPLQSKAAQRLAADLLDRIPADAITPLHPTTSPDDTLWREWVLRMQMLLWRRYSEREVHAAIAASQRDTYWRKRLHAPDAALAFYYEAPTFILRSRPLHQYTPNIGDRVTLNLGRATHEGTVVAHDRKTGRYVVETQSADGAPRTYRRSPMFLRPATEHHEEQDGADE